ncbi:NnrS family protein [Halomonas sp. MCCC 1A17488]|uniref:NnrS family protein n=1 Tax=Billgrantia sulfidoxydans TaxID=2733484 RepID=A0ABX7W017_9GAMM|nr:MULTISPECIES: NnrS family protein [Halomonas]MCE8017093.1 NnrS family protein [Halomonas sp. MCCC 1A17488]MCG3240426.1 NnrS family protein [Halomonas sp. MCCC 1A17488]QPP49710.1 NnrS family protein [Halomonas sp. SS10-MC5]QTP53321.1 NnrS family protein [Halomonas sulfidoxydans]
MFNVLAKSGIDAADAVALRLPAWRWLFPLAALHAALMAPLSLLALFHGWAPVQLASPAAHAREMLFGFALAVIAGYLLGPLPRRQLGMLVALWLVGRLGVLDWPGAVVASLADGVFALWLAARLVPRFIAAKKWRNRLLSPLLGMLCLLAVVTLTWRYLDDMPTTAPLMHQSVLWLVLLMTFMGGRVIAPAVNGYLIQTCRQAGAGVQPRIEGALIVLLGLAAFLAPWEPLHPLAALLVLASGVLVLWRIRGWQPVRCRARPDLLVLMLGYAWIAIGLVLLARNWWAPQHASTALHAFTVGALGTLASGIMLRHVILRAKRRPEQEWALLPLAGLFAVAAVLRLWAIEAGSAWLALLWASALSWGLGWLLVAWRLRRWLRLVDAMPAATRNRQT